MVNEGSMSQGERVNEKRRKKGTRKSGQETESREFFRPMPQQLDGGDLGVNCGECIVEEKPIGKKGRGARTLGYNVGKKGGVP